MKARSVTSTLLPTLVVADEAGVLMRALSRLFGEQFGLIEVTDEPTARAVLTGSDAIDGFLHTGRRWLPFACYEIRLSTGPHSSVPIITCSFEPPERLRTFSEEQFGDDLLATSGWYFVRLPFLVEGFQRNLQQILAAPRPVPQALHKAFGTICQYRANEAWADFEHACRNAASQGAAGWLRLREESFPRFSAEIAKLAAGDPMFFADAREKLRALFASPDPMFGRLRGVGIALPEQVQASAPEPAPAFFASKLMVVEDDAGFAAQLKRQLEAIGHTVLVVSDASAEPSHITLWMQRNRVEVVLLDLNFGSLDTGFRILRAIKERGRDTKVVVLTGYGQEHINRARRLGADGYLLKPPEPQSLADAIRRVLIKRRILVVDDELDSVVTEVFTQQLSQRRCNFSTYTSAEAVLAHLDSGTLDLAMVDLVLLDLRFGDRLTGKDLFRTIKQQRRDLPIFVLTGVADDRTRLEVVFGDHFSPQDDYLVKPLGEAAWGRIWAALFPLPECLVLSRQDLTLRLLNASGSALAEVRLQPRYWTFLGCLIKKRQNNREGVDAVAGLPEDDPELREAASLGGYPYAFDEQRMREVMSRINRPVSTALGYEWRLIEHLPDGRYVLSPACKEVAIDA
jgi:two-component system chemotaxis response regulator CheY